MEGHEGKLEADADDDHDYGDRVDQINCAGRGKLRCDLGETHGPELRVDQGHAKKEKRGRCGSEDEILQPGLNHQRAPVVSDQRICSYSLTATPLSRKYSFASM